MKYNLPILLQNENIDNLVIDNAVSIRKITRNDRIEFFGIEKIDYGFVGSKFFLNKVTKSEKNRGRYSHDTFMMSHILYETESVYASNYIVEIDCDDKDIDEIAKNLDLTFNISKPTNTGCYVGFREGDTDVRILGNPNHRAKLAFDFLNFNERDLVDLPIIYKKITGLNQEEKIKFELFMDGLHNKASTELKFICLVIALENMFLPDTNMELKLRFSLRIAKIIDEKISKKTKRDVYALANSIYDTRGEIVHGGYSKKLTMAMYAETVNLLWVSLVEYINNPEKFEKKYLNEILL